ncbi:MAG: hypothetical protein ACTSVV_15160, partial [Promethearchaeota archaeon]
ADTAGKWTKTWHLSQKFKNGGVSIAISPQNFFPRDFIQPHYTMIGKQNSAPFTKKEINALK